MDGPFKKVGFVGSDARTDAMVWHTINNSPYVEEIYCAPGNAGIASRYLKNGKRVRCFPVALDDIAGHFSLADTQDADVVIVSPELPLVRGASDVFAQSGQKTGRKLFGCNQNAARFEGSKVFAQRFAQKHGVKFAPGECFNDTEIQKAKTFAESLGGRCAVKADGLRGGKGVEVCHSVTEANAAIDAELTKSPARIVIQELLEGDEVSLMVFCDGKTVRLMETARDYKRELDDDRGKLTGGMGAYSSEPLLSEAQLAEVRRTIIEPWLAGCEAEGIVFKGVLYIGLMVTKDGIFALEFNVRLGDPEAQVLLPRLQNDFLEIVDACISGTLDAVTLRFRPIHSLCVVMASRGYPGKPEIGKIIHGLDEVRRIPNLEVYHAGTDMRGMETVTSGGRVLTVTGWSQRDLRNAAGLVYGAIREYLGFDGVHFRGDIGKHIWKTL